MNPYIVFIIIVAALVVWFVVTYNHFQKADQRIKEAYSTMDVFLVKRYDLIPNLVATVKGYAQHESGLLTELTAARTKAMGQGTIADKLQGEKALSDCLGRLLAVAENYPDLKANTNFLDLQAQLKAMEDDIASARRYYNATVREYNTACKTIPSNLVAGLCHFQPQPLFEVEDAAQRDSVKVSF